MTEDNELIEVMAEAMHKRWMENRPGTLDYVAWADLYEDQRAAWRDFASAALTAYRNHQVEL